MVIWEADKPYAPECSQLDGSNMYQGIVGRARYDVDISYV